MSKGFATVIRYRQDDDQRSSRYDELLAAEMKASKTSKGVHDKKEAPTHRVADLSGVITLIKQARITNLQLIVGFIQGSRQVEAIFAFLATSRSFGSSR